MPAEIQRPDRAEPPERQERREYSGATEQPTSMVAAFIDPGSLRLLRSIAATDHAAQLDGVPSKDDLLRQFELDKNPDYLKGGEIGVHASADLDPRVAELVRSLKPDELEKVRQFIDTMSGSGDVRRLNDLVSDIPADRREAFQTGLRLELEREHYDKARGIAHTYYDSRSGEIVLNVNDPKMNQFRLGHKE